MTVLAGPVAEMIYREEEIHPAAFPPWQHDWALALKLAEPLFKQSGKRIAWLEAMMVELRQRLERESCRAAIAAVADELLAHEFLDSDQLEATIGFWLRRG
jgi:hypothetical protein